MAMRLPRTKSSTLKLLGPTLQPGVSSSMNSHRVPAGSLSPILIAITLSFTFWMQSVIVTLAYNFGGTRIPSLFSMSKAPPSEPAQDEDEDLDGAAPIPAGAKNYLTP